MILNPIANQHPYSHQVLLALKAQQVWQITTLNSCPNPSPKNPAASRLEWLGTVIGGL
jgi:hypothetical protein